MRYLRLLFVFLRIGVMRELAYRGNFFVQLFVLLLELATALGGLAIVFAHTATLGGWRPDEVLALVGIYFLIGGVIRLLIQPSMERLIEGVREGTLDFTLTKPEDAQLLVSLQRVEIWSLTDILLGFCVVSVALVRLGDGLQASHVAAFAVALPAGVVIVYSFWLFLATLSFWFVRVENILVIFQSMYEAGRWPVSLYPAWLRFALTFLVPIAFATTVPAQALAGHMTRQVLLGTVALAIALFVGSRLFWRAGIRRYSGASA
ncbi:MAG TPA: ABC-2 family transporter protein [Acidobacteriota bacterium]|nr:ABC-2 family transporter protein [Acidobacteriota bacterium]